MAAFITDIMELQKPNNFLIYKTNEQTFRKMQSWSLFLFIFIYLIYFVISHAFSPNL